MQQKKEDQESLAKTTLIKEIANLRLENKQKDLIAKNVMQELAEMRLKLKEKEGR
ncbi:hypothetical protein [Clostridium botulinum]|uniref:hypothetical protein n=1 Tax=Clostridium botulinum TaxID=1491 RepID=UPI001E517852|nr:hypothetical protein [Clostridium botulinum]